MSGDDARVAYPLFQKENGGSQPTSPLQLEICEISIIRAKDLNTLWHSRLPIFNTGFCDGSRVSYGALFEGVFYAIAIWSNPVAPSLPQRKWLELRRMAIADDAPRNTASRMLKIMAGLIRKKFPEVVKLISYQDIEVHQGTIYKASGWIIGSYHKGGSWNRPNSFNTYNKKPRTRPDLNKTTGPKIRWEKDIQKCPTNAHTFDKQKSDLSNEES